MFPSLTICTQLRTLRTGSYAPEVSCLTNASVDHPDGYYTLICHLVFFNVYIHSMYTVDNTQFNLRQSIFSYNMIILSLHASLHSINTVDD